jgi:hypothetical protein
MIGLPLSEPSVPATLIDSTPGSAEVRTGAFGVAPNATDTAFEESDPPTELVVRNFT